MQGYHVSIPSESQMTISHCYLKFDTGFTESSSHMGTHIWKRKAPKHPTLSMIYIQIGLYIPESSKTGCSIKNLQKTACFQVGVHTKLSGPCLLAGHAIRGVVHSSYCIATLAYFNKMILLVCSCLKISRVF